jgi:hypothetical protein
MFTPRPYTNRAFKGRGHHKPEIVLSKRHPYGSVYNNRVNSQQRVYSQQLYTRIQYPVHNISLIGPPSPRRGGGTVSLWRRRCSGWACRGCRAGCIWGETWARVWGYTRNTPSLLAPGRHPFHSIPFQPQMNNCVTSLNSSTAASFTQSPPVKTTVLSRWLSLNSGSSE